MKRELRIKPTVQVRKPPASVDAFVQGVQTSKDSGSQTSKRSNAQASKRRTLERADGRQVRRLTVYLPAELASRLAVHCAKADRDLSDVVAEAVERLGV